MLIKIILLAHIMLDGLNFSDRFDRKTIVYHFFEIKTVLCPT